MTSDKNDTTPIDPHFRNRQDFLRSRVLVDLNRARRSKADVEGELRLDPFVEVIGQTVPGARIDVMVELFSPEDADLLSALEESGVPSIEMETLCISPDIEFADGSLWRKAVGRSGEPGSTAWFSGTVKEHVAPGSDLAITVSFARDGRFAGYAKVTHASETPSPPP